MKFPCPTAVITGYLKLKTICVLLISECFFCCLFLFFPENSPAVSGKLYMKCQALFPEKIILKCLLLFKFRVTRDKTSVFVTQKHVISNI